MDKRIILYIAMSLDGYIADSDGGLDFLSVVEKEGEDYGYEKFVESVDTIIMGRKTYDKVLSFGIDFPHAHKRCYILTRTQRPDEGNITFYNQGNLKMLIQHLKSQQGKDVFVDGGADVVNELLKDGLIDELIISVVPVLLGGGVSLFKMEYPVQKLTLSSAKSFDTGLVQLHYITDRQ
ncbi:MAG: bifunctional deaminase-reductase domain protein [Bacteroidetes bacterium]|jgi:dihydrofolate reductase|nr:bifunctional deaminase-reductase domain protein [Bacteroidota bacterium]